MRLGSRYLAGMGSRVGSCAGETVLGGAVGSGRGATLSGAGCAAGATEPGAGSTPSAAAAAAAAGSSGRPEAAAAAASMLAWSPTGGSMALCGMLASLSCSPGISIWLAVRASGICSARPPPNSTGSPPPAAICSCGIVGSSSLAAAALSGSGSCGVAPGAARSEGSGAAERCRANPRHASRCGRQRVLCNPPQLSEAPYRRVGAASCRGGRRSVRRWRWAGRGCACPRTW